MSILRSDSRTQVDVRSLTIRMSLLSRSDGSSQFSFGDLKALGAVTGPAEVRLRDERPTEATVEVNVVPVCGPAGPTTKSLSHSIKLFFSPLILLKKYPRSLIQINLQTLSKPSNRWSHTFSNSQPDTSPLVRILDETQSVTEKAALINAASLALIDSAVCMRGCGFAIGVAIIPASAVQTINPNHHQPLQLEHIVLDPNPYEESCATSLHLVGFHFGSEFNTCLSGSEVNSGQVTLCESNGTFDYDQLQKVLKYASIATEQILTFSRKSFESNYEISSSNHLLNINSISSNSNQNYSKEDKKKRKKNLN